MKSSSGNYYIGLDHIRAVATFMVFCWHFSHAQVGGVGAVPVVPFSLLTEGHTGVSLFMALSGYLFAKLIEGKQIRYLPFLLNRGLRLAPLLAVLSLGLSGLAYAQSGQFAVLFPHGSWSIRIEAQFYLLLPLLLMMARRTRLALPAALAAAIGLRVALLILRGEVQSVAYWTLGGRIDQFLLGILAFQYRDAIKGRHALVVATLASFAVFFRYFELRGGYSAMPTYPSPSPLWVVLPTLEGIAYGLAIAWYDNAFVHPRGPVSRFIARIGTYSYSIYLLHFPVAVFLSEFIYRSGVNTTEPHLSVASAALAFMVMVPIGALSFHVIERPFLKLRVSYLTAAKPREQP